MATFKPGIISHISGSQDGTTFVDSPYAPYMRPLTIPINTWSIGKQTSKQRHISVNYLWWKLTPKQAKGWQDLASTMIRINKSKVEVKVRAYDLFKKVNRNLIEIGEPPIFDAPKKVYPKQFRTVDVDIYAVDKIDDLILHFTPAIHKDTKIIISASSSQNPGRNSPKKHVYKQIVVIDSNFKTGSSFLEAYLSVYKRNVKDTFRIAFSFRPVSKISGLSVESVSLMQIPVYKLQTDNSKPGTPNSKP